MTTRSATLSPTHRQRMSWPYIMLKVVVDGWVERLHQWQEQPRLALADRLKTDHYTAPNFTRVAFNFPFERPSYVLRPVTTALLAAENLVIGFGQELVVRNDVCRRIVAFLFSLLCFLTIQLRHLCSQQRICFVDILCIDKNTEYGSLSFRLFQPLFAHQMLGSISITILHTFYMTVLWLDIQVI